MSNFWNTSDGKTIEKKAEHESGGGFGIIPDGTKLLAMVDEAGWNAGFEDAPDVIKIRWTVLAPDAYKNRKIFQNLKVNDEKTTTADNAKRMLMAIDQNAGGKLSKLDREPEDNELMGALLNKTMVIRLGVWEMGEKTGNWINAVSPRGGNAAKAAEAAPVDSSGGMAMDDDIPFAPLGSGRMSYCV